MVAGPLLTLFLGRVLFQLALWGGWLVGGVFWGYAAVCFMGALTAGIGRRTAGFGIANQVTLLRAGLVCMVGSALLAGGSSVASGWSVAALAAAALSLDAVDGWLARRLGLASDFGARFDLEVDALLLVILALLVWQTDRVGSWVLAIGLLRYVFVLAGWLVPWLRKSLPPSRRRQAVCVQQGITLLLCLLPPVDIMLANAMAAMALSALLVSFATDIIYLRRASHGATTGVLDRRADRAILTGSRY
jgi:phosphatidylglycerophosphate synthase